MSTIPSTLLACTATSSQNVTTGQYDTYRTGATFSEAILTPANVNSSQFGYLFSIGVDNKPIYAQPLVVHNLQLGFSTYCTVIFVATMDNYIYAFNGDSPPNKAHPYLWRSAQFDGAPAPFCVAISGMTQVGILSTPVADVTNQLLYFVTVTDLTNPAQCGNGTPSQNWVYTLHAISLKNGAGFGGDYFPPIIISGAVPGTGDNTTVIGCAQGVTNCVPFIASEALQRPALLDVNGTIYVAFGFGTTSSQPDESLPYHGWVFGYKSCATDVTNCVSPNTPACYTNKSCAFQQVSIFNTTPNSHGGGIWMSGRGPAAGTNGEIYVSVGNACGAGQDPNSCGAEYGGNGYGESVVNVSRLNFFAPTSRLNGYTLVQSMNYNDLDLGSGGVLIIPPSNPGFQTGLLVAGDKVGNAYLLPTSSLGGAVATPYQTFLATTTTATCPGNLPYYPATPKQSGCADYMTPAFWSRGFGGFLYIWGTTDTLRAFPFSNLHGYFQVGGAFVSNNPRTAGNGGILAISAETPTNAVNAILWAISGSSTHTQGTLQAYQLWSGSLPSLNQLWSSDANGTNYFTVQRFVEPVVSHGKVYVTTNTTDVSGNYSLWVYGLCIQGPGSVCGIQPGTPNN